MLRLTMFDTYFLTFQWRTKEFCSGWGFNKFSWGQRTGIWGQ